MKITTISQFAESLKLPFGLFRTLRDPKCETDVYGDPIVIAGGSAAVFKIVVEGKTYALKCYTKPKPHNAEIYRHIETICSPLIYETHYLPKELYVYNPDGSGEWHDVLLTEWIESKTLEYELRKALHYGNPEHLASLSHSFDTMAVELLSSSWAHGDLKPNNIVVEPNGHMRLLDYDAIFHPTMTANLSAESGTPQFNHPRRDAYFFNKHTDDYSIALLSAMLRTIARNPAEWKHLISKEMMLFDPDQILKGRSKTREKALEISARNGDAITYRLLSMLTNPTPVLNGIDEIMTFAVKGVQSHNETPEPYREDGIWGYGTDKIPTIPPIFDSALTFTEGMAAVQIGGYNHFITSDGHTTINCSIYQQIEPFSCGKAAVKKDGLWGYIDKQGAEVIPPQYTSASSFREGRAKTTTRKGSAKTLTTE